MRRQNLTQLLERLRLRRELRSARVEMEIRAAAREARRGAAADGAAHLEEGEGDVAALRLLAQIVHEGARRNAPSNDADTAPLEGRGRGGAIVLCVGWHLVSGGGGGRGDGEQEEQPRHDSLAAQARACHGALGEGAAWTANCKLGENNFVVPKKKAAASMATTILVSLLLPMAVGALHLSPPQLSPQERSGSRSTHLSSPRLAQPSAALNGDSALSPGRSLAVRTTLLGACALATSSLAVAPALASDPAAQHLGAHPPILQLGVLAVLACPLFQRLGWEPPRDASAGDDGARVVESERSRRINMMAKDDDDRRFTIGGFTSEQASLSPHPPHMSHSHFPFTSPDSN